MVDVIQWLNPLETMAESLGQSNPVAVPECLFSSQCGRNIIVDGQTARWNSVVSGGRVVVDKPISPGKELTLSFDGKGHAEIGILTKDPASIPDINQVENLKELTVIQSARIYKQTGVAIVKRSLCGQKIITEEDKTSSVKVERTDKVWVTVNIIFGDMELEIETDGYSFSKEHGGNIQLENYDTWANLKASNPCAVCFVEHPIRRQEALHFQIDPILRDGKPSRNSSIKIAISQSNPIHIMSGNDIYYDITSLPLIHFDEFPKKCKNEIQIGLSDNGTVQINHEKGTLNRETNNEQIYCIFELCRIKLHCKTKQAHRDDAQSSAKGVNTPNAIVVPPYTELNEYNPDNSLTDFLQKNYVNTPNAIVVPPYTELNEYNPDNSLTDFLQKNYVNLIKMIDTVPLLDLLYQFDYIRHNECERFGKLSQTDRENANRELLNTIIRRQSIDLDHFVSLLIQSEQIGVLAVVFPEKYGRKKLIIDAKNKDNQLPWLADDDEFHGMLSRGEFLSYENRLSLGGPCKAGKSTLASVLIGDEIPLKWNSTDGLVIFFGRNGIDIEKRKMVPLEEGKREHDVLTKVLRGNPDISKKSEHLVRTTHTKIHQEIKANIKESNLWTRNTRESQENKHSTHQSVIKPDTKITSTLHKYIASASEEFQAFEFKKLQLQSDILEEVRNGKYKIKIAPSDLVDFGGQKSYDMTHQLFIQHSGSFLLMFDGQFGLHNQLLEYPDGVTAASILKHWVDSILAYTEDIEDIMPMILFAATHRDQCKQENTDELRESFIRDIKKMFSLHEKKSHIHLEMVYFINAIDKRDVEIQRMTDQIVTFAMKQSSWGQRRPMQWVPLELQITNMRMKNINIIRKEDLRNVNKLNGDLALNDRQLDDFLLVQHSLGKLMYYHISGLDQFIIVHTPAMVNILRSFVTDEKFFPTDKNLKSILEKLTETGKIYKSDLFKLWQQDQFNQYMPENAIKEFVVELLIHLDVLIIPKAFKQTPSSAIVYIVPCMIKAIRSSSFNLNDRQRESTICIKYSIKRHSIPPALAYKVIGAALNAWPLKYESKRVCLYHKAAVLNVSEDNELRIMLDDNRVMVYLSNDKTLLSISPDVAASVQECLTKNMELSLLFHYNSFGRKMQLTEMSDLYTIEVGIPCGSDVCFLSVQEVMQKDRWICDKGKEHDTKYLRYWFFNKTQKTCGHGCKGLNDNELQTEPSDKHLVRLGSQIDFNVFREFVLYLGMDLQKWQSIQSTYAAHSSEGIRAMALKQWKNSNLSKLKDPTLKDLSDALTKVNQNSHLICQIFREKSELFEIADLNLQEIPRDQHLKDLSIQIGNCPLQLGIELGLSFTEVEQSLFRFPKDLPGLVEDILAKWKTKSKVKTIHSLMMALERLEAGGVRYLRDISKCSK